MSDSLQDATAYIDKVRDDFALLPSRQDVYEYLIEFGSHLGDCTDDLRREDRRVQGCVSGVYLDVRVDDGRIVLRGCAESLITRGFVRIIIDVMDQLPVDDLQGAIQYLDAMVADTGLAASLVSSRAQAFGNIVAAIRDRVS